jgi:hypothetical protein
LQEFAAYRMHDVWVRVWYKIAPQAMLHSGMKVNSKWASREY